MPSPRDDFELLRVEAGSPPVVPALLTQGGHAGIVVQAPRDVAAGEFFTSYPFAVSGIEAVGTATVPVADMSDPALLILNLGPETIPSDTFVPARFADYRWVVQSDVQQTLCVDCDSAGIAVAITRVNPVGGGETAFASGTTGTDGTYCVPIDLCGGDGTYRIRVSISGCPTLVKDVVVAWPCDAEVAFVPGAILFLVSRCAGVAIHGFGMSDPIAVAAAVGASIVVTGPGGFSFTGTTDSSGEMLIPTALIVAPGMYDYTITLSPWATATGSVAVCLHPGPIGVSVPVILATDPSKTCNCCTTDGSPAVLHCTDKYGSFTMTSNSGASFGGSGWAHSGYSSGILSVFEPKAGKTLPCPANPYLIFTCVEDGTGDTIQIAYTLSCDGVLTKFAFVCGVNGPIPVSVCFPGNDAPCHLAAPPPGGLFNLVASAAPVAIDFCGPVSALLGVAATCGDGTPIPGFADTVTISS